MSGVVPGTDNPRGAWESRAAYIERACQVMHYAYETAAVGAGWETQAASRKPWADVPEANKATMRAAVDALLDWHEAARGDSLPASPTLPEGRADGRERAWEEGFKAGGRWSLLDEEWFEDSQDFDKGDLPPRPPKPTNPYSAAPVERGVIICAPRLTPAHAIFQAYPDYPVTIKPSILCPDCGLHGFVTNGRWLAS